MVIEASQSGAVVIGDEGVEVGVAFGMVEKAAMVGGAVLRHATEMLAKAGLKRSTMPLVWAGKAE